ncbi:MAG: aldo/keto reductase [Kiritimatiellae bacterium]|nr:aldo/keto reductase [Kiritimatiellia bacterium]
MTTSTWKGYSLSRLMLGTAQFGMPYGVANRKGQPDYREVVTMVAAAVERGVNCFDTAAAYGSSEEALGRALRDLGLAERVVVVTKVRHLTTVEATDATLSKMAIERSVADSRRRLGLDCLPVVMFHQEADAAHLDALEELKARGWIRHVGVSCGNRPGPAAEFVAAGNVSALQLPGNVIDRRHQRSGVFRDAAARGVAGFIRSVFLQGLLVMPEDSIPPALRAVIPVRRRLAAIAGEAGITLTELVVRYMLAQAGVTCVIVGVETVAQVRENTALFGSGPLDEGVVQAVDAVGPELPEAIVTPALWPALRGDAEA